MMHEAKAELVCQIVSKAIHELALQHAQGLLGEDEFVTSLLLLEQEQITPRGLMLTATNTLDDWTHFDIRIRASRKICAGFEFNPQTGVFRRSQLAGCEAEVHSQEK